jgi:hypothetical protein
MVSSRPGVWVPRAPLSMDVVLGNATPGPLTDSGPRRRRRYRKPVTEQRRGVKPP